MPVNLGSSELVSINQLVDIVEEIAGVRCERSYQLDAPQGVRGRNSDNTQIMETYGWEPSITLVDGLAADLRLGLRPGQARPWAEAAMRILVHDYSGHPFQVELSRELARRGHEVTHSYCEAYVSGKGHLERRARRDACASTRSAAGDRSPRHASCGGCSRSCGSASSWSARSVACAPTS